MADSDSSPPLELLLRVQDLDTLIAQLQHRRASLPERHELATLDASLAESSRRTAEVEAARAELIERQKELEAQIASAGARREVIEQRMYAARGTPARDLQAMDDEIKHLHQRREQFEDSELEVMVALEPVDAELAVLAKERTELASRVDALRAVLCENEAAIDEELAVQIRARADAAAGLPADLESRYESLRAHLGGTGAARLVGNRCSGCHLELPSMEVERIRHLAAGTVVTCEQCGRILVPASPPPPGLPSAPPPASAL